MNKNLTCPHGQNSTKPFALTEKVSWTDNTQR